MPTLDLFRSWDLSFQCQKVVLDRLVRKTMASIPAAPTTPALGDFYVSATSSSLQLIGTDINTAVMSVAKQGIQITDVGKALLPAKRLASILRELEPEENIAIGIQDNSAVILSDNAQWNLPLHRLSSFPTLNLKAKLERYPRAELLSAIERIKFAASTDPFKVNLSVLKGLDVKFTACDGSRLQQVVLSDPLPFDINLAVNKLDLVVKALRDSSGAFVSIGQNEKYFILATDINVVALANSQPVFPNVEKAILKPAMENTLELVVDRVKLIDSLNKVKPTADMTSGLVNLAIAPSKMEIRSKDKSGNSAVVEMPCEWVSAPRIITVSFKSLIELLNSHITDKCVIKLGQDTKTKKLPLLVRDSISGITSVLQQSIEF